MNLFAEPYRFRCPEDHSSIRKLNRDGQVRCKQCSEMYEVSELQDVKA